MCVNSNMKYQKNHWFRFIITFCIVHVRKCMNNNNFEKEINKNKKHYWMWVIILHFACVLKWWISYLDQFQCLNHTGTVFNVTLICWSRVPCIDVPSLFLSIRIASTSFKYYYFQCVSNIWLKQLFKLIVSYVIYEK